MADNDVNETKWLMSLQADLEEMERTDPEVAAAALGFNQMAERLAITPVESRAGNREREPDVSDIRHVAINCDRCGEVEFNGDYRTRTQAIAFTSLRRDAATKGWAILANQDLCPACAQHDGCVYPERCCMECHRHKVIHVGCILR